MNPPPLSKRHLRLAEDMPFRTDIDPAEAAAIIQSLKPPRPSEIDPVTPNILTIEENSVRALFIQKDVWVVAADFFKALRFPCGDDPALLAEVVEPINSQRRDHHLFAGDSGHEELIVVHPGAAYELAKPYLEKKRLNRLGAAINREIDRINNPHLWPTEPLKLQADGSLPPRPHRFSGHLAEWNALKEVQFEAKMKAMGCTFERDRAVQSAEAPQ